MKWSVKVAQIAGIEVRIHLTFFLLLAFWALLFASGAGASAAIPRAVTGVAFICALFFCVLLHEFGHALAAKRYGVRTIDITLLPIGGLARLERMPEKPMHEFVIAIAGPLVNVVIAAVLCLFLGGLPTVSPAMDLADPKQFLANLAIINITLVVFNMLPAFPMDGGRVLRSLLATRMNYARATEVAGTIGQMIAILLGLYGFMGLPETTLILLISIFIFFAAQQETAIAKIRDATNGLQVSHAMITEFHTLSHDATLRDCVDKLLAGWQHDFPVLDENDDLLGILQRSDLIAALAQHGQAYPVRQLVRACPGHLNPYTSLSAAMDLLHSSSCRTLPVYSPTGAGLAGLLDLENIGEMIMINAAISKRRG